MSDDYPAHEPHEIARGRRSADLRWIALARLLIDLAEQLAWELERIEHEADLADQLSHELRRVEDMIEELSQRLARTQDRLDAVAGAGERRTGSRAALLRPYVAASERDAAMAPAPTLQRLGGARNPAAAIRPIVRRDDVVAPPSPPPSASRVDRAREMLHTVNVQSRVLAAAVALILLTAALVGIIGSAEPSAPAGPGDPHTGTSALHSGAGSHGPSPTWTSATLSSTRQPSVAPTSPLVPAVPSQSPADASTPTAVPQASATADSSGPATAAPATVAPTATTVPPPVSGAGIVAGGVGSLREQMAQVFGPHESEQGDTRTYQGGSVIAAFSPEGRATSVAFVLDTDEQVFTRDNAESLAAFYRPPDAELVTTETDGDIERAVYRSDILAALFAGDDVAGLDTTLYVEEIMVDGVSGRVRSLAMTLGSTGP